MTTTDFQVYPGLEMAKTECDTDRHLEELERIGYFVVEDVFDESQLRTIRRKLDACWDRERTQYGEEHLSTIGDMGVCRAMMDEDDCFMELLVHPVIHGYVARTLGESAIVHLQNGIMLFPARSHNQGRFHKDFPKPFLATHMLSFNALIVVDEFNASTGGTWVVPGSHKCEPMPSAEYIQHHETQLEAPAGSVLFFDSTLWHRGGSNRSGQVRRAINQQYTKPFIKQQLDYPALLASKVDPESKLAQTLGFWSVPPKSVAQYRTLDPAQRTYRSGQG